MVGQQPRRGGQSTGRRWSAKHGTPVKTVVGTTTPKGWQNDNFRLVISLLCHHFGVVDFISSSSRGYASLHHLPVVVPALRASLHNRLPYKTSPHFARHFYFKNLSNAIILQFLDEPSGRVERLFIVCCLRLLRVRFQQQVEIISTCKVEI